MGKILGLLIFMFSFQNPGYSNNHIEQSLSNGEGKVRTITVYGLIFKKNSSKIISGQKEFTSMLKIEFNEFKSIEKVEIIDYLFSPIISGDESDLSIQRAIAIKQLMLKHKFISSEIIFTKYIHKKLNAKQFSQISDENKIELKIYYSNEQKPNNSIYSSTIQKNKKSKKSDLTPTILTKTKSFKVPITLVEPDMLVITVNNEKGKIINKYTKQYKKRGTYDVEVPIESIKPGKYTISILGLNRSVAKASIEIYSEKK
jgi:hypothetical protein